MNLCNKQLRSTKQIYCHKVAEICNLIQSQLCGWSVMFQALAPSYTEMKLMGHLFMEGVKTCRQTQVHLHGAAWNDNNLEHICTAHSKCVTKVKTMRGSRLCVCFWLRRTPSSGPTHCKQQLLTQPPFLSVFSTGNLNCLCLASSYKIQYALIQGPSVWKQIYD